jgi:hypothetical protein
MLTFRSVYSDLPGSLLYFAGTARNHTNNPNKISVPINENSPYRGWKWKYELREERECVASMRPPLRQGANAATSSSILCHQIDILALFFTTEAPEYIGAAREQSD